MLGLHDFPLESERLVEQQPAFPFDYTAHAPTLPEELRGAHFIDRLVGVLHDVKLVVQDCAARTPILDMSTQAASIRHLWRALN